MEKKNHLQGNQSMNFKNELNHKAKEVEGDLKACLAQTLDTPKHIVEAMEYSLCAGGKRLRPILVREVCKMLGGDVDKAIPLSNAIEMIHTYSLIHDDLPAMDNDDLRRGKPTNHKVYGEAMAILAGDALLNFSMETAIMGIDRCTTLKEHQDYVQAMALLFRSSGIQGMIGGQVADIEAETRMVSSETELLYIHQHKTAALIKAAIGCGALVAGADKKEMRALDIYGDAIGLSFQIVDDILDVEGDEALLGKPIGSDEKNHKTTFVSLYGLEEAKNKVLALENKAHTALNELDVKSDFLKELNHFICHRVY